MSWGSRSIVKMVQNENAMKFYSTMAVAREAFKTGRPIGEVDSLLSIATSHYFKTPGDSRASNMRKKIDDLELDVSHWRDEK